MKAAEERRQLEEEEEKRQALEKRREEKRLEREVSRSSHLIDVQVEKLSDFLSETCGTRFKPRPTCICREKRKNRDD